MRFMRLKNKIIKRNKITNRKKQMSNIKMNNKSSCKQKIKIRFQNKLKILK